MMMMRRPLKGLPEHRKWSIRLMVFHNNYFDAYYRVTWELRRLLFMLIIVDQHQTPTNSNLFQSLFQANICFKSSHVVIRDHTTFKTLKPAHSSRELLQTTVLYKEYYKLLVCQSKMDKTTRPAYNNRPRPTQYTLHTVLHDPVTKHARWLAEIAFRRFRIVGVR